MSEMVEIDKDELAALEVAYNALGGHQRIELREMIRDLDAWAKLNPGPFSSASVWWTERLDRLVQAGERAHQARAEARR